jgi:endonuclease I
MKQGDLDPDNSQNVLLMYGYDDADGVPQTDRTRDVALSCHTSSCYGLWNREHVFAKSLATPPLETDDPGSGTDVHNLSACDSQMNASRSNREFESGSGNTHITNSGNWYPGDEWKGDVARIIMYMYVRYPTQCLPLNIGIGTANESPNGDMPYIFLEWNASDPVSQLEINRNNTLEAMQGNRNPFIDNPYLATLIWNGDTANDTWSLSISEYNKIKEITIYPTITHDYIYIKNPQNKSFTYSIYNMQGQLLEKNKEADIIDVSKFENGYYLINIAATHQNSTTKVFVK